MQITLEEAHAVTIEALKGCGRHRAEALTLTASYCHSEDWYQMQQHLLRCDAIGKQWLKETQSKL